MDELESTKKTAVALSIFTFIALIITIFVFIRIFNNESLNFKSYEIEIRKNKINSISDKTNKLEELQTDLENNLITLKDISRYDKLITPSDFEKANNSDSDAEYLLYMVGFNVVELDNVIEEYNQSNKLNQFVNENFNQLSSIFFCLNSKYWNESENENYEWGKKETLERLKYAKIAYPINLKDIAISYNDMILTQINIIKEDIANNEKEISDNNKSIISEEKRLENVGIRNTSLLISRGITVVMAIVILLSLLAIFGYGINLYNKSQIQHLILVENRKKTDIEVLKLLFATNIKFDNKAENYLCNIGKKS